MDNRHYIADDPDEAAPEALPEAVLTAQVRKCAHRLDKKLQFSQSKMTAFSQSDLKKLSAGLDAAVRRFGADRPDLQWAAGVRDNYLRAIRDGKAYVYPWEGKPSFSIAPEEFDKLIRTRRSIRKFTEEPIPHALIRKIVAYGGWAPSCCNMQSVRYIVVTDPDVRARIVHDRFTPGMGYCTVAVVADYRVYEDWNIDCMVHDSAAAIENILLACHYYGVGACYVSDTGVDTPKKREALRVGEYEKITALLWLGQYDQAPAAPARRKTDELVQWL